MLIHKDEIHKPKVIYETLKKMNIIYTRYFTNIQIIYFKVKKETLINSM